MNRSDSAADDSHHSRVDSPAANLPYANRDAGYDLETGVLARAREWIDVFPWLRMVRTLRVAGSPPLLLLVALTFAVWNPVATALLDGPVANSIMDDDAGLAAVGNQVRTYIRWALPTALYDGPQRTQVGRGRQLSAIIWSLLIWTPAALLLLRQGALLSAGRPLVGFRPGLAAALRQTPFAWLAAAVPLVCVLLLAILIWLIGLIGRLTYPVPWFEAILATAILLVAVPCGLLIFGANFAVPLAWAALANERDRDVLDSLSRGYEYLLRRPLHLIAYSLAGLVILSIISWLAAAVSGAAASLSLAAVGLAGASQTLEAAIVSMLISFPAVVLIATLWALIGSAYLLLRYDAGGQEVEELWTPTPASGPATIKRDQD